MYIQCRSYRFHLKYRFLFEEIKLFSRADNSNYFSDDIYFADNIYKINLYFIDSLCSTYSSPLVKKKNYTRTVETSAARNNVRTREIRVCLTSDENRRSDSIAGNYAGTSDASCSSFGWVKATLVLERRNTSRHAYVLRVYTRVPFLLCCGTSCTSLRMLPCFVTAGYELLPRGE